MIPKSCEIFQTRSCVKDKEHDPEKLRDFSDNIMRQGQRTENESAIPLKAIAL